MRRGVVPVIVLAAVMIALAAGAAPPNTRWPPQQGGTPLPEKPKPDLVITNFNLVSWGQCAPGQTVFTFSVTFKNQGRGTWTGATPYLDVRDLHPEATADWFYNVNIFPPMAAGEVRTLQIPIMFYSKSPAHMTRECPHPFQAVINPNHAVEESNYDNNAGPGPAEWHHVKVIGVCPDNCRK